MYKVRTFVGLSVLIVILSINVNAVPSDIKSNESDRSQSDLSNNLPNEQSDTIQSDYVLWSSIVNSLKTWSTNKLKNRLKNLNKQISNVRAKRSSSSEPKKRTRRDEEVVCYSRVGC